MSSKGAIAIGATPLQDTIDSPSESAEQPRDASATARELAAAQIKSASRPRARDGDHGLLAAVVACEHTYRALTRSIGRTSAHAIMSRALVQTQSESSILEAISIDQESDHALAGIAEVIQLHGAPQVTVALQSMLEHAFELLGRLVGPDIVNQLVTQNGSSEQPDDEDAT
ncbi:MAG: hypothetical protein M3Y05_17185 [Gemmatimonadota bacterium]|nr:hypothetical protein [Gemmatimonadota bacterium]